MSKYQCWLNTGKSHGDNSLRAVSIADSERLVWLNLPKADAKRLALFCDELRASFGKKTVTIDLETVVDRIERNKDGRRLQLASFAELLSLAKSTELVKPDEPTAEDITAIADFFGSASAPSTVVVDDDPFAG